MKLVYPGMLAHLADGSTVQVTDVVSDGRTGCGPSLVLATHGLFGPDVVAPITAVWRVDEDVHLRLTVEAARQLPRFEPATTPCHRREYIWWPAS